MRIVFGIMSAVHASATVTQLARALAPHPVLIHHDFSQQPDFEVDAPNASFVANPFRTGWDDWGFCQGIFRLLSESFADPATRYFQLLSPTCLPLRPLDDFVAMVGADQHDAHNEFFELFRDDVALLNFAYRAFAPAGSVRCRLLWRCLETWSREAWHTEDRCNLQVRIPDRPPGARGHLAHWIARLAARGWLGPHPFHEQFLPLVGGTWFGANRVAARHMIEVYSRPPVQRWFASVHLADEMLISTALGNSTLRIGPSNHFVNVFDEARPRWISAQDLPSARASGRYFGRKFADDPNDPVRLALLREIGAR